VRKTCEKEKNVNWKKERTNWLSPCSPSTYASILFGATSAFSARTPLNRAESRLVPVPKTWFSGSPLSFLAKYVRISTGLATSRRIVCGLMGAMALKMLSRMCRLRLSSDRRDSPGFCFAPAVMTTMSAWPASACVAARTRTPLPPR
jgi:hypothetical protein